MQLREWNARLHGLVVFRALLGDPVVAKLAALTDRLEAADDTIAPLCDAVAAFEAALFAHTTNLGDYLSNAVLETETFCVRQAAAGQLSPVMEAALNSELNFLQKLCGLTLDALLEAADRQNRELAFLPRWEARQLDLTAAYNQRMREAGKKGYGMFAKHHVFTVENGQLVPVKYPDPQKLSELPGYEKEREKVIANTRALLAGSPANNVLLYGDAGTGKSSTVKAIANEYAADGLRLVEVKKNQLYQIPDLMDQLAANPLKFILFIDDLSFSSNDDNFCRPESHPRGQRGRPGPEHCGVRHLQPPPPHQGDPDRPHRRRHPRSRHPAGADEPFRPVRPDRHLPAAREGPLCRHSGRAGKAAPHPDAHGRAAGQGRGLRHPRRRPQPPRGQTVHRTVRERRAEIMFAFSFLWIRKSAVQ